VTFSPTELTEIVRAMAQLDQAGDGWINLIPTIARDDERSTSLSFYTLLSGGGSKITMGTWTPPSSDRSKHPEPRLGITHLTGRRAVAELQALSVPVPGGWFVEQDHRRRGIVMRVPPGEPHEQVLAWALRAVRALSPPSQAFVGWRADIYLPISSRADTSHR